MSRCGHCPLGGDPGRCPGESSRIVCEAADPRSPKHQPTLIDQLRSFMKAVVQHVAAGVPQATVEETAARLAICRACNHYDDGRCRKCGCGLEVKASWAEQACPIGKW